MVNKYSKISVIYGGSGRECAKKITAALERLHTERLYPIQPFIVANKIMGGASVFKTVRDAIASSRLSIVILTFDDIDGTRIRQNVLIEIGMALMAVENTDNCIFLSEKVPLPEDFPSDLKGLVNPNYFDKDSIDEVAENVCDTVIEQLKLTPHENVLGDPAYYYDYAKILDDVPQHVFEQRADVQLRSILDSWREAVASFGFASERIMYLLERLKFFPVFKTDEYFFEFIADMRRLIVPQSADFARDGAGYINAVYDMADSLLHYTDVKMRKDVLECMRDPSANPVATQSNRMIFAGIVERLKKFLHKAETDDRYKYNWFVLEMAYEYVGLAVMKVLGFSELDESAMPQLEYARDAYYKVIEIADEYGGPSAVLWRGYSEYNLTRVHETMYTLTKKAEYLDKIREYSYKSIATRREWCRVGSFKGAFTNALSFEYFLVKRHELEIQCAIPEYKTMSQAQMAQYLAELETELRQYYGSTELGRLYDMKVSLDSLKQRL